MKRMKPMKHMKREAYICIMAGGVGSRFWPSSREALPKQFLDIGGSGQSLIQLTFDRFAGYVPDSNIFVVTHEKYRELTARHLPRLEPWQIIGEPARKNTGPAALLGTLAAAGKSEDAIVVMAPADHLILKEKAFHDCLDRAILFLRKEDALITIGIEPHRPHTGYGYIRYEEKGDPPYPVRNFTEKPDRKRAEEFLKQGNYLWNAGIFVWSARYLIQNYRQHAPTLLKRFEPLTGEVAENWSSEQIRAVYEGIEGISFDYLIMEKAEKVRCIPGDIGWSDLGSWSALMEISSGDPHGNVLIGDQIEARDLKNCLLKSDGKRVLIARDLEDLLIVNEEDVLLIMPLRDDQKIKQIRKEAIDRYGKDMS